MRKDVCLGRLKFYLNKLRSLITLFQGVHLFIPPALHLVFFFLRENFFEIYIFFAEEQAQ